ncbi:hypothetical protein [Nocardioides iriomotensis]|jgi:hypothetical protein|nr:hypothetical protein [Nocardioides iriomotensis]
MTALVLVLMLVLALVFVVVARADRRERAGPRLGANGRRRTTR